LTTQGDLVPNAKPELLPATCKLLEFATAVLPLIIASHYPRHLKDRDSLG